MSTRNSLSVVKNDLQHSIGSLLRTQSDRAGIDPAPWRHHVGEVEFCGRDHFLSWVLKGDRESLAQRVQAGGLINQLIEILRCQICARVNLHHHTGVNIFKAVGADTRRNQCVELGLGSQHLNDRWHLETRMCGDTQTG